MEAFQEAGHEDKAGEPGGELGPALKDFRPDVIVIDNYFDTEELTAKLEAALGD